MDKQDSQKKKEESFVSPDVSYSGGDGHFGSKLRDIVEKALVKAHKLRDRTRDEALQQTRTIFSKEKEKAVEELRKVEEIFQQTSRQMKEQEMGAASQYTEWIAEQIQRFSGYLKEKDINQLMSGIKQFAQRRPELFLGSALTTGFLLARFLKSSH